ncbi:MAG: hypothetical protein ACJ75J_01365 [Cytophagaceae bacterium]
MERLLNALPVIALGVGAWAILGGVLHDIFVLKPGKPYDRDLLRLLMDGHILITCGVIQMLTYSKLQAGDEWGFYIAIAATISMIVYCFLIFPFLKSFGTIFMNAGFLVLLVIGLLKGK